MEHWSVNTAAAERIEREVLPNAEKLNIDIVRLSDGATVLDMGVRAKGGFRAGRYFAELGMGGLGRLSYVMLPLGGELVPGLQIITECPAVCEMASYVAATTVSWHGHPQVISGPARSILGSDHFAQAVGYRDPNPAKAVAGVADRRDARRGADRGNLFRLRHHAGPAVPHGCPNGLYDGRGPGLRPQRGTDAAHAVRQGLCHGPDSGGQRHHPHHLRNRR
jgi:hypothetical protein